MAKTASKLAEVLIGETPTELGEVRSFSISTSRNTIDVSQLSTEWKEYLVGQGQWTCNLELWYDPADTEQEDLATKARSGDKVSIVIRPQGTGASNPEFSGDGVVTSWDIAGATEDAIGLSLSIQGTGALTQSAQAASGGEGGASGGEGGASGGEGGD